MANAVYGKAKEAFANKQIDWLNDNIKCVLIDTADYTVAINTHEFLSDVAAGAREETSSNLTSKTNALGVCDAADPTFSSTAGDNCEAFIVYQDTGSAATSRLIAYIDTAGGLPVTLGGDIAIRFNASGIFAI